MSDILAAALWKRPGSHVVGLLKACNLKLEQFRYLLRPAKDLRLIDVKRFEFAAGWVDEVGRQAGG